jgi:hypothetical protein
MARFLFSCNLFALAIKPVWDLSLLALQNWWSTEAWWVSIDFLLSKANQK